MGEVAVADEGEHGVDGDCGGDDRDGDADGEEGGLGGQVAYEVLEHVGAGGGEPVESPGGVMHLVRGPQDPGAVDEAVDVEGDEVVEDHGQHEGRSGR